MQAVIRLVAFLVFLAVIPGLMFSLLFRDIDYWRHLPEALSLNRDSRVKERPRVGGVDFCVPKENRWVSDIWWIPKSLPEGGFSFVLSIFQGGGVTSEIMGGVSELTTYPSWKRIPAPDTQWWKMLSVREGRRLIVDGQYIAAASLGSHYYLVWRSGQEPVSLNDEYSDKSEVMASCRVPEPNDRRVTCDRVIHLNSVAVHYTFDDILLDRIDWLDKQVVDAVTAWQCSKSGQPV